MNKKPTLNDKVGRLFLASMCILTSAEAVGVEIDGVFNASVGRSDNVLRTVNNQIEESMATIGLELDVEHTGRKLFADLFVGADYVEYLDDAFDSDVVGGVVLDSSFAFIEDRLAWGLEYNFGQQVFDPLAPIRPDNRENVSYLTTGPRITIPIGPRFEFNTNVDYSDTSFEVSPNDQTRLGGRLSIGRLMNAGRTLSIVGTVEDVEYDQTVFAPDFKRRAAFLRFESVNSRGEFSIDLGANELDLEGLTEASKGTLVRLDWLRMMSDGVLFRLSAGSLYSDQGNIFRFFQNASFDLRDTEDVSGAATPFRNNYATVVFSLDRPRTQIDVVASYSDEDYEIESAFDREVLRLDFSISRDLTRRLFGELGVGALSRTFFTLDREDKDVQYTVALGYRFNSAISATLSYQLFTRDTNDGVTEFDEDRIFLQLSYVPKWSRE